MTTTDSATPPNSPNDGGGDGASASDKTGKSVALSSPLLDFSAEQALADYLRRDYPALSRRLLAVIDYLHDTTFRGLDPRTTHALAQFAKHFFFLFTQPDWKLSEAESLAYIASNPVIANLALISEFGTTDAWLRVLLGQPANLAKVLALYSPRNRIELRPKTSSPRTRGWRAAGTSPVSGIFAPTAPIPTRSLGCEVTSYSTTSG